jgi:hypothetical protein
MQVEVHATHHKETLSILKIKASTSFTNYVNYIHYTILYYTILYFNKNLFHLKFNNTNILMFNQF